MFGDRVSVRVTGFDTYDAPEGQRSVSTGLDLPLSPELEDEIRGFCEGVATQSYEAFAAELRRARAESSAAAWRDDTPGVQRVTLTGSMQSVGGFA